MCLCNTWVVFKKKKKTITAKEILVDWIYLAESYLGGHTKLIPADGREEVSLPADTTQSQNLLNIYTCVKKTICKKEQQKYEDLTIYISKRKQKI